ncbi:hypothetical protein [Herbidospora sp. RD11066]
MNTARLAAAAAIVSVSLTVLAVGAILIDAPDEGLPEETPLSYSDVTAPPDTPRREVIDPLGPTESVGPSRVPVRPPLETAKPTVDPNARPTVEVWGDPALRSIDLLFGGFQPGEVVMVTNEGREAAQMEVDEGGSYRFRGFIYHRSLPDGPHEFTATGQTSGRSMTFTLNV